MIAIGLDLSLQATGIAYVNGTTRVLDTPKAKIAGYERIDYIVREVHLATLEGVNAAELRRIVVGIEGYNFGAQGQSGIRDTAELGGVVRHHLWTCSIAWVEIPPTSLKKFATGSGGASKDDMLEAAQSHLDADIADHNCADAAWLRAAVRHHYGRPPSDHFPLERIHDLDAAVVWPETDQ